MAARLRPLVAEPMAASVPRIPEPAADDIQAVRHTEYEALAEIGALLQFAASGGLRFGQATGIPAKTTLDAIHPLLAAGDWFPTEISRIPDMTLPAP